jgi:hypothetical protein
VLVFGQISDLPDIGAGRSREAEQQGAEAPAVSKHAHPPRGSRPACSTLHRHPRSSTVFLSIIGQARLGMDRRVSPLVN